MSGEPGASRYAVRLEALERVSARLRIAGVPHVLRRHVRNGAPSPGDRDTMPVLDIAGWRWVKVLYWDGVPMFSYPYLAGGRWPVDADGVDRLASKVTMDYLDAKARGEIDERGM